MIRILFISTLLAFTGGAAVAQALSAGDDYPQPSGPLSAASVDAGDTRTAGPLSGPPSSGTPLADNTRQLADSDDHDGDGARRVFATPRTDSTESDRRQYRRESRQQYLDCSNYFSCGGKHM